MQTSRLPKQVANNTPLIQMAQDYIAQLQSGENQQAEMLLQEINQLNANKHPGSGEKITQQKASQSDHDLYSKVGKLTRELHDSMSNFMNESRLHMMTNEDMPDARQRLQHVVELTEQSAHTTMSLIEHSNPLLSQMQERADVLRKQLHNYKENQHINANHIDAESGETDRDNNDPMYFNEEIDAFLHLVSSSSKNVESDLNKIMLAQNYQDLTGQVIQRVSRLVQEVEENLLTLLQPDNKKTGNKQTGNKQSAGEQLEADAVNKKNKEKQNNNGYGPAVPGVSKGDVLHSQEEVDDLLSSLGF